MRIVKGVCVAAFLAAGCTSRPAVSPSQPAPWGALTSPTAAMSIVFSDICMTAVKDQRSIEDLALNHWLRAVPPRSTGSPMATAAWRLASYSNVFVLALPDGACSASVEAGDPAALRARAVDLLALHGAFQEGQTFPGDDSRRAAWCTAEARRPLIAVLVERTRGRRPAFVANVFRAQDARPPFCAPAPG
ncbi:hypothetical protein [uncultured Brevundimonas sp.]|uniref:hypothetical protein n=1 Tax=uncultured Brevundimonas sp. TaxID=213418 RepID=UPI0025FCDDF2|nr:hypothetical protein [uncultured Brevundimonas sp.]